MKTFNHAHVCIADKNGVHFNTICSPDYSNSEVRNMKGHLNAASKNPKAYHFIDLNTATIIVDGMPYGEGDMCDDELLMALGV